jgi:CheY-like chemotaxis protein
MIPAKNIEVLLVEDDPADVELTREGLKDSKMHVHLSVVEDGVQALKYLRKDAPYSNAARPDLIILDLNLPKKDGREVLEEIKGEEALRCIPVVVLTTSQDSFDIQRCYKLGANCWVSKPIGFDEFVKIVNSINDFWFTVVKLPPCSSTLPGADGK